MQTAIPGMDRDDLRSLSSCLEFVVSERSDLPVFVPLLVFAQVQAEPA